MPKWTGGCTRHEVRVAIEVKHLMRALGGPKEYLDAPKPPPEKVAVLVVLEVTVAVTLRVVP